MSNALILKEGGGGRFSTNADVCQHQRKLLPNKDFSAWKLVRGNLARSREAEGVPFWSYTSTTLQAEVGIGRLKRHFQFKNAHFFG
jgi:hypothetical protein